MEWLCPIDLPVRFQSASRPAVSRLVSRGLPGRGTEPGAHATIRIPTRSLHQSISRLSPLRDGSGTERSQSHRDSSFFVGLSSGTGGLFPCGDLCASIPSARRHAGPGGWRPWRCFWPCQAVISPRCPARPVPARGRPRQAPDYPDERTHPEKPRPIRHPRQASLRPRWCLRSRATG